MEKPKDCRECPSTEACLALIAKGMVPYCGGSLCKPKPKD